MQVFSLLRFYTGLSECGDTNGMPSRLFCEGVWLQRPDVGRKEREDE